MATMYKDYNILIVLFLVVNICAFPKMEDTEGKGVFDCQFEEGFCNWKDISTLTTYNWQRTKGPTKSSGTGPPGDHTTNSGYYLFTESSSPATFRNKASLISEQFNRTNSRCLTFFYSMYGKHMGALQVFIVDVESKVNKMIWSKKRNQGEGWKEAEVDLQSKVAYKIRFECERGSSYKSDFGLDDIYFREGPCTEPNTTTTNSTNSSTISTAVTTTAATTTTTTATTTAKPITTTTKPTTSTTISTTVTTTVDTTATSTTTTAKLEKSGKVLSICTKYKVKPLGCFSDKFYRALPKLLDEHRSGTHKDFYINWSKFGESSEELLCHCIKRAKQESIKFIGLQFYGECWGGSTASYDKQGNSRKCVNTKYKECSDDQEICVGRALTNYVYEIL